MQSDKVNYPNLLHCIKKLAEIWNRHEEKEDLFFPMLEKKQVKIPVDKFLFEHKKLRPHREEIEKAIQSGSEFKVKKAVFTNGDFIITELRKHMEDEEIILNLISQDIFNPEDNQKIQEIF
jgi:DUF438 domain-containing protein